MIRPQFKTYREPPFPPENPDLENQTLFQAQDFLAGLIKDANPEGIPPNALQNLKNTVYTRNQLFRRNGLQAYAVTKPDTSRIMAMFAYSDVTTGINLLRFTPTTVNRIQSGGWVALTGPTLHSTSNDRYSFTVADGVAYFSNGGADVIQKINPVANTYAALGDAPKYKYIASGYNRIIGANLRAATDVPYQIGWSGDLNYAEWNSAVDISAGSTPLVNSPSDLSDDITGIFPLSSVLCITRQRSIWLATNIPSATNPFNFFVAVPRIGCDAPGTIALAADGLIFYNYQTSSVYFYSPLGDGQPQEISQAVRRAIKADAVSPDNMFASYNPDTSVYSLFLTSNTTGLVKCYSYSFRTKTWVYDEFTNVSSVTDIDYASSDLTINQLTGTIAALAGTIDQLGGLVANASRFFGFIDGTLCTQPLFTGNSSNVGNIVATDNGTTISTIIDSKTFTNFGYDTYYNYVTVEYTPYSTGSISLQYSKDDGNTWTTYKTATVTSGMLYKSQIILSKKPVKTRNYIWRISSSDCMFSLNNFKVLAEKAGLSTK